MCHTCLLTFLTRPQVVQRLEGEASTAKKEAAQAQEAAIKHLKAEHAAALDQVHVTFTVGAGACNNLPATMSESARFHLVLPACGLRACWPMLNTTSMPSGSANASDSPMQARGSQQRYADRHRETAAALAAAQDRADVANAQVAELRKEAASRNEMIGWLEEQVKKAQLVRTDQAS